MPSLQRPAWLPSSCCSGLGPGATSLRRPSLALPHLNTEPPPSGPPSISLPGFVLVIFLCGTCHYSKHIIYLLFSLLCFSASCIRLSPIRGQGVVVSTFVSAGGYRTQSRSLINIPECVRVCVCMCECVWVCVCVCVWACDLLTRSLACSTHRCNQYRSFIYSLSRHLFISHSWQVFKESMDTKGERGGGGRNWEIGIDTYILSMLCIK